MCHKPMGTGLMLNQDITAGVSGRFRSLPIARWALLAGAVLGDMVRYLISVLVTLAFGLILGFRVTTNPFAQPPRACSSSVSRWPFAGPSSCSCCWSRP